MTKKKVVRKRKTPPMTLIPELKKAKDKKDNDHPGIMSQDEIDHLMNSLSNPNLHDIYWMRDANTMECVKENLKRAKTPQDYFDVVLELIEERNSLKERIEEYDISLSGVKENLRLVKEVVNKLIK